jgi:uncharacterized membrane protein
VKLLVSIARTLARLVLGGFMLFAGVGHFRSTDSFLAQVPPFLPAREFIVQASGVVEIAFALALLLWTRQRVVVGWTLAAFYVLVFPGNISQALTHTSAFGLDTDTARAVRLLFQPVLVAWAIWCTDGWRVRHEIVPTVRRFIRAPREE